jgi:hypothetical protein
VISEVAVPNGEPVEAGDEMDVPEADLWRLAGKFEPLTGPEVVETRDPEPEHRDPKRKGKA